METKLRNREQQIQLLLAAQAPKSVIQKTLEEDHETLEDALTRVQNLFMTQTKEIGVDISNFSHVCKYAVKFVNSSSEQIELIIGDTLTGQQKKKIAGALTTELFQNVPSLIIEQTIQSQYELMFGVKHLAVPKPAETTLQHSRRGSIASSSMADVFDDFSEEEKALPTERLNALIPVSTPKTKRILMSIRRNRRKPDA
jgi:hypothetical protein